MPHTLRLGNFVSYLEKTHEAAFLYIHYYIINEIFISYFVYTF